jgi:hypothetical protein
MGCSRLDPDTFGAEKPVLACKGCVQPVDSNLVKRVARQHGLFSGSFLLLLPAEGMGFGDSVADGVGGGLISKEAARALGETANWAICVHGVSLEGLAIAAQF